MTIFTVSANVTYGGAPTGVDTIDFTNAIHTVATATFAASDFDNVKVLDNVAIEGTAGTNNIVVSGGSLDASGWQFTGWNALADNITINGTNGAEIITGSSQNDTINGGFGVDTLIGGDGDDTFGAVFENDTIDGGSGTADTLLL